jgi:lysophospholipase L1-like esterase
MSIQPLAVRVEGDLIRVVASDQIITASHDAVLDVDGQLLTRAAASLAPITRPALAADPAFAARYAPLGSSRGSTCTFIGESETELYGAWPWWLNFRSNGELTKLNHITAAWAQSTITSNYAAANLSPILSPRPGIVFVCVGRNEEMGTPAPTFTEYKANIRSIVAQIVAVRARPVLLTIPPRGADGTTSAHLGGIALRNRWLKNYAAANDLPLVDIYQMLVDPLTGRLKSTYATTSQNMPVNAHVAIADEVIRCMRLGWPSSPIRPSYEGDPGDLCGNGIALVDTNADGLPDNWGTATMGSATMSVVNDVRFHGGRAIQVVQNNTADLPMWFRIIGTPTTKVSPGDTIVVTCSFSVEVSTGFTGGAEEGGLTFYCDMPAQEQFWSLMNQPCKSTAAADLHRFTGLMYFPINNANMAIYNRGQIAPKFRHLGLTVGKALITRVGDVAIYNCTREGSHENGFAAGSLSWVHSPGNNVPLGS